MHRWITLAIVVGLLALDTTSPVSQAQDQGFLAPVEQEQPSREQPNRRPLTEEEMVRLRQQELLMDFDAETSLDHGESIHPQLMSRVIDNTPGIRFEEREAYLRILRLAEEVPLKRQEQFAAEIRSERRESTPSYRRRKFADFPQFVDLFTHPEFYRGRPVTIQGVMRKLTKLDLGKNSLDLDQAYEGWVYTPDCQGNPTVVVFTSRDERLPVSGDLQEEVRFTGYFFKMYGYDAFDTPRKAPLIIAGEVERMPHGFHSVYRYLNPSWYLMTAMLFLFGCYVIWQINRQSMSPRPLAQVEPDFNHFPPREHPVIGSLVPHAVVETEDS